MNKDQLLDLAKNPRPPKGIVRVMFEGEERIFHVRGLMGTERDAFEQSCLVGRSQRRNFDNLRARLVVLCLVDADGQRMFNPSDAAQIGMLPAALLDPIFAEAQRLSGMTAKDVEELQGNSESGPSAASTSASP